MRKSTSNPVTMISNLDLHLAGERDEELYCYCTLRLGSDQFSCDDTDYTVTLTKVLLHIELSGYEMVPGTKFGENVLDPVFVRSTVTENQQTTAHGYGVDAGARAKATPAGGAAAELEVQGKGHFRKEVQKKRFEKSEVENRVHRVLSRGDNYWDISDVDDEGRAISLRAGTYLNNDQLCGVIPVQHSNRLAVTGTVMVRKPDIEDKKSGLDVPFGRTKNKEKIMKLLTAETLAKISGSEFSRKGFAAISMVEVTDEES